MSGSTDPMTAEAPSPRFHDALLALVRSRDEDLDTALRTLVRVDAETLGVDFSSVTVRMGDTRLLPFGRGAFASRGAVVGANAVAGAAARLRSKALTLAGTLLQCDPETLTIHRGRICRANGEATTTASLLPMPPTFHRI